MSINLIIFIAIGVLFLAFKILPIAPYLTGKFSGATIPIWKLVRMQLKKRNVENIVSSYVVSHKAGLNLFYEELEVYESKGGDTMELVKAMIIAKREGIEFNIEHAHKLLGKEIELEKFMNAAMSKSENDESNNN